MQVGAAPQDVLNLVQLYESIGLDVQLDIDLGAVAIQDRDNSGIAFSAGAPSAFFFGGHQARSMCRL